MGCTQSTNNGIQAIPYEVGVVEATKVTTAGKGPRRIFELSEFHDEFTVDKRIGKGAFAHVYRAKSIATGKTVAAKVALHSPAKHDESLMESLTNEISIMRKVNRSEYCVGASAAFVDDELCYIVMEMADNTLPKALDQIEVTEKSLRLIFRDMLQGLKFLHGLGIVHRDVKPDNFLCNMQAHSVIQTVRLCDFGLSMRMPPNGNLTGVFGTAPFMCPEMVKSSYYNEKADIWSVGVIVYVMLTGRFPYMPFETTSSAMKEAIRIGGIPSWTPIVPALKPSPEAEAFGSALLTRSQSRRPNAQRALEFDFLASSPPLGRQWYNNSLRSLIQSGKKIGAFNVRMSSTVSKIDELMMVKQSEADRKVSPASTDEANVSMEFGPTASSSKTISHAAQSSSLDSLPSMVGSRMWATKADASEAPSQASSSTATSLASAVRPGQPGAAQTLGVLPSMAVGGSKAKTMDTLPTMDATRKKMSVVSFDDLPDMSAPVERLRGHAIGNTQRINHCVKPAIATQAKTPKLVNMDARPAGCAQNVVPRSSLKGATPTHSVTFADRVTPGSVQAPPTPAVTAQRKNMEHDEARPMTVDVLPTFGAPTPRSIASKPPRGYSDAQSAVGRVPSTNSDFKLVAHRIPSVCEQSTSDSLPMKERTGNSKIIDEDAAFLDESAAHTMDSLPSDTFETTNHVQEFVAPVAAR